MDAFRALQEVQRRRLHLRVSDSVNVARTDRRQSLFHLGNEGKCKLSVVVGHWKRDNVMPLSGRGGACATLGHGWSIPPPRSAPAGGYASPAGPPAVRG